MIKEMIFGTVGGAIFVRHGAYVRCFGGKYRNNFYGMAGLDFLQDFCSLERLIFTERLMLVM
jgi:hypothetical protein